MSKTIKHNETQTRPNKIFGTDGIRGTVGTAPITPDFVLRLGYAAGIALVQNGNSPNKPRQNDRINARPTVLIGKDTRISGYMMEAALQAGFAAAGVDVLLCGPLPTPAIAYLTRALRLDAGVVVSASHNLYPDNGIKFFSAHGQKLPDTVERKIEEQLLQPIGCVPSHQLGKAKRISDAAGRYIEFCKSTFPLDMNLHGMTIAIDCAHGAAYHIAPVVLHELGADVVSVGVEPNGCNINDKVGSTIPESISAAVQNHKADIGIALDGDGDRVIMADASGQIYDGDAILYIIAKWQQKTGFLGSNGVVGTQMSNLGLEQALARNNILFTRAEVGDRKVLMLLEQMRWRLGGENSGHILCLDKHSTGDGIIAALQVLAALRSGENTLKNASRDLIIYPQKLINVRLPQHCNWQEDVSLSAAVEEARSQLGETGRILLRASGTEPVLRVMVEGPDADQIAHCATLIAKTAAKASSAH